MYFLFHINQVSSYNSLCFEGISYSSHNFLLKSRHLNVAAVRPYIAYSYLIASFQIQNGNLRLIYEENGV
jgi:hypothetical protein